MLLNLTNSNPLLIISNKLILASSRCPTTFLFSKILKCKSNNRTETIFATTVHSANHSQSIRLYRHFQLWFITQTEINLQNQTQYLLFLCQINTKPYSFHLSKNTATRGFTIVVSDQLLTYYTIIFLQEYKRMYKRTSSYMPIHSNIYHTLCDYMPYKI